MFLILLITLSSVNYSETHGKWGYGDRDGPSHWKGLCKTGTRQSPIDIHKKDTKRVSFPKLRFHYYDRSAVLKIRNIGHSVEGEGFDVWHEKHPYIEGGGLKHKYKLLRFHLHWGTAETEGSEHKINGHHYPAELHLVHIRTDLPMRRAEKEKDGYAVISIFLKIGTDSQPLAPISKALRMLEKPGFVTYLTGFSPNQILPKNKSFYRYNGSLTTPQCNENVIWTVMAEPISITNDQLKRFRNIKAQDGTKLTRNFRHTNPLKGRNVLYRATDSSGNSDSEQSGSKELLKD